MFPEQGQITLFQILFKQCRAPMLAHEINGLCGLTIGIHGFRQGQGTARGHRLLFGKKGTNHRHGLFFRNQRLFGAAAQQALGRPVGIICKETADPLKTKLRPLRADGHPFRYDTGNAGPKRCAERIAFGDIAGFIGRNRLLHGLDVA